jgi:hypothetical protein
LGGRSHDGEVGQPKNDPQKDEKNTPNRVFVHFLLKEFLPQSLSKGKKVIVQSL